MIPVQIFYLTGADGEKLSGTVNFYQYQGDDIFSFRFDFSGDRFDIKKSDGLWIFSGGMENYLNYWVEELSKQIEAATHF